MPDQEELEQEQPTEPDYEEPEGPEDEEPEAEPELEAEPGSEAEPEPQPEPLGRQDIEGMLSGMAQQMQDQFDQRMQQMQQRMLQNQQQPRAQRPKGPEPHPWATDPLKMVEDGANAETARFFQSLGNSYRTQFQQMQSQFQEQLRDVQNRVEADRLGRHFESQRESLMSKHDLPEGAKPLVDKIIVGTYTMMPEGGDPYRLNFDNEVKALADMLQERKVAHQTAKKKAAAKQKAKPGGPSKNASPTKPGRKKREISNMDDFDAMADELAQEYFGEG
jgi:hypothetical protein